MPYYEVNHSVPLSDGQRERLAQAITDVHVQAFKTPSLFVNVRFVKEDLSQGNVFVGGKRETKKSNSIISYVRTSPSRTKEDFDRVAKSIEDAWYATVGDGATSSAEHPYLVAKEDIRLHAIGLLPIVTAREAGFTIPTAGEEKQWIGEQLPVFQKLAQNGESSFVTLLEEVKRASQQA